jgi:hypothetical protein
MNRRNLLALVAVLPALATPAGACSITLSSPRLAGQQRDIVRRLFERWWARDASGFRAILSGRLMDDGSRMASGTARALDELDPVLPESLAIFDRFFTGSGMTRRLHLMVNTAAGVLVGCSEIRPGEAIEADCSGMPQFHLFLVTMSGLSARLISHISTVESPEPAIAYVWREGEA